MALDQQNREKAADLEKLKFLADQAEEARLLDQELKDSLGFREETGRIQRMLKAQEINGLRSYVPDGKLSQDTQEKLYAFRDEQLASETGKRLAEMEVMRESLSRHYPPDQIPNTYSAQKDLLERTVNMEKREDVLSTAKNLLQDESATGVNVTVPGMGQVFFSKKKADALTKEIIGMQPAELQRKLLDIRSAIASAETNQLTEEERAELKFQKDLIEEQLRTAGANIPGLEGQAPRTLFDKFLQRNKRRDGNQ